MTNHTTTQSRSLLDLPSEVQTQIYHHLVVPDEIDDTPGLEQQPTRPYDIPLSNWQYGEPHASVLCRPNACRQSDTYDCPRVHTSILRVCRETREIALPIFFDDNIFFIPKDTHRFGPLRGGPFEPYYHRLRALTLEIDDFRNPGSAQFDHNTLWVDTSDAIVHLSFLLRSLGAELQNISELRFFHRFEPITERYGLAYDYYLTRRCLLSAGRETAALYSRFNEAAWVEGECIFPQQECTDLSHSGTSVVLVDRSKEIMGLTLLAGAADISIEDEADEYVQNICTNTSSRLLPDRRELEYHVAEIDVPRLCVYNPRQRIEPFRDTMASVLRKYENGYELEKWCTAKVWNYSVQFTGPASRFYKRAYGTF